MFCSFKTNKWNFTLIRSSLQAEQEDADMKLRIEIITERLKYFPLKLIHNIIHN